ncbi:MAG TPA: tetratricopeptide repeat protein [Thermoanaerobaculia bacterium]|nr:tetratricopeptide repeat protein [Thermoanaerobaculia bacterium]
MRHATLFCLILLCAISGFAQTAPAGSSSTAAADTAKANGDHDAAIKLYDEVLAREPNNVHALVQSALLLSWKGQHAEAVNRYDRALAIDPNNAMARLERAKVLSWNRQFPDALKAFREVVGSDPNNAEAQMGVARVLSWSGDLLAARAEYLRILERNPGDTEALVGVAQTYAWSGNPTTAREWYQKALDVKPDLREAIVGMSYVDLAEGDVYGAFRRTSQLEGRFPNDRDVLELRTAVHRARAPFFRAAYERSDDTEDNEMNLWGLEGVFVLPRRAELTLGFSNYEIGDAQQRTGQIQNPFVSLILRPGARQRLVLRPGIEMMEKTDGSSETEFAGRVSYAFGIGSRFETSLDAERRAFRATTRSLDAGVILDSYSINALFRPHPNLRFTGSAALWNFSDTNERQSFDGSAVYQWPIRSLSVSTGYAFHYFDYEKDLDNGYFDPEGYEAHAGTLFMHKEFKSVYASAFVEAGVQSFHLQVVDADRDPYLTYAGTLGFRLTPLLSLELSGTKSDSSSQSASGFESTYYAARIRVHTR